MKALDAHDPAVPGIDNDTNGTAVAADGPGTVDAAGAAHVMNTPVSSVMKNPHHVAPVEGAHTALVTSPVPAFTPLLQPLAMHDLLHAGAIAAIVETLHGRRAPQTFGGGSNGRLRKAGGNGKGGCSEDGAHTAHTANGGFSVGTGHGALLSQFSIRFREPPLHSILSQGGFAVRKVSFADPP